MTRKRKLSEKSSAQKITKVDLSEENVDTDKNAAANENVNNKNLANICHKKSHGANNWQIFKQTFTRKNSNANPQNSKPNRPKSKKIVNKQHSNTHNNRPTQIHKINEHSKTYSKPASEALAEISRTVVTTKLLSRPNSKFTWNAPKSVTNENKLLVQKHSQDERNVLTKHIAMDCEMVGVEIGVDKNMLARISLINSFGDCVYDKFVKPSEPVLDYRTRVSGVRPEDLEKAEDFKTVQKEVADILKGRILIGHALKNDLRVLFLSHPKQAIRDTSKFKKFRQGRTPSLKKLAMKYLGVTIQEGEHSSVQDALAAMQLYRMFKKEWEANLRKPVALKPQKKIKNTSSMMDT